VPTQHVLGILRKALAIGFVAEELIMTVPAGSFTIGKIQCIPISDGNCPFPPCVFLADVPDQELKARGLPTDAINSTFTCLLVSTGKNKVLIDTGAGNLAPSTGKLLENLAKAGAPAQEIDTVILTHAHPDHIGGAIDGEGKPEFPNAKTRRCILGMR
jgi:glyoxylase-like metal-dependent hydrolase (beta-lactamase superfamily II)